MSTTRTGLWSVQYGWGILALPYAHAQHGSVVHRTFVGPWALVRAIRWIRRDGKR